MRALNIIAILLLCVSCKLDSPDKHLSKFNQREKFEKKKQKAEFELKTQEKDLGEQTVTKDLYVPFELSGHTGDQLYTGYIFEYNGIRYLGVFLDNEAINAAAVVDYSQFFNQDTLVVNGRTWVALVGTPNNKENE